MMDDGRFGDAIHALLKEFGWTHGELTPSLVHQALAQVRHLRKTSFVLSNDDRAALAEFRECFASHNYTATWKRALALLDRLLAANGEGK